MRLLVRILRKVKALFRGQYRRKWVGALSLDPVNPEFHFDYASEALKFGDAYLAYAEFKTSAFLGGNQEAVNSKLELAGKIIPNPMDMDHNQYFRMKSLADELVKRAEGKKFSVLDVGGGDGKLSTFLPDADYCLAEPTINGIAGQNLPFASESFDYVVSCHVLEHIPLEQRDLFLDTLLSKAKQGVILLNPFAVAGSHESARLELIIELTGAEWAKEHLDCALPTLEYMEQFSSSRGVQLSVQPNGTLTTSLALVFASHFAGKAGRTAEMSNVNSFFNANYMDILDSNDYPVAYLLYLQK
jgi:hypothetical protein